MLAVAAAFAAAFVVEVPAESATIAECPNRNLFRFLPAHLDKF